MAIVAGDLLIKYTGGAANSDPNVSLGGTVSSNGPTDNALHNLFDEVSGTESLAGDTEYRCIVCKNNHGTLTAKNFRIYISADTGAQFSIALDGNGNNTNPEGPVANESTAPSGESFSQPTTYAGGLAPADVPAGQHTGGIWVKRVIPSSAAAETPHTVTMQFDCDTDA